MLSGGPRSAEVLHAVRQRTQQHISCKLLDADALAVALCASSVDAEDLLQFVCERDVRREAVAHMKELALKDDEFCALFACDDPEVASQRPLLSFDRPRVVAHEKTAEAVAARSALETALNLTLQEPHQCSAWKAGSVLRCAAHVALHRNMDAQRCVSAVVGGMIAGDSRRLENLKFQIEDDGIDVLSFASAIGVLAHSVA